MARGVLRWFRFGLVPSGALLLGCGSEPPESSRMPAVPAPSTTTTAPTCEKIAVYPDADRDGHAGTSDGTAAQSICAGEAVPDGYAPSPGFGKVDCDDGDPSVFRSLCADRDSDGAYDPNPVCVGDSAGAGLASCPFVLEWTPDPGPYDCDDTDPARIDYFYRDADGDGFGAGDELCFHEEEGYSAWGGDCDDDDPSRAPLALEIFGDGLDSDCDGEDGSSCTSDGLAAFEWPADPEPTSSDCVGPDLALGSLSCSGCFLTSATLAVENRGDSRFEGEIVVTAVPGRVDLERADMELSFTIELEPGERRVLVSGPFSGPYEIGFTSAGVSDCSPDDNEMSVAPGHCI